MPVPITADVPTAMDHLLSRLLPHVAAALVPVLAGLLLNNPALAVGGAMLAVVYSNLLMRRRLLGLYRGGAYRRFLEMADRIQASFPLPFRPVSNLPELRAIARVKVGEAELGKQIFRSLDPNRLPLAFRGISTYNMAIMFLEMQDPGSALEILDGLDREGAGGIGDLLPLLRNAHIQAHFLLGQFERAAEVLVLATAADDVPPPVRVACEGWSALLALEKDRDPSRARELSRQALSQVGALESVQSRDWLLVNHALIELEAGGSEVAILEQLAPLLPHEPTMSPHQRGLLHYVTARCHQRTGQLADARRELEQAAQDGRTPWLEPRFAELGQQLAAAPEAGS